MKKDLIQLIQDCDDYVDANIVPSKPVGIKAKICLILYIVHNVERIRKNACFIRKKFEALTSSLMIAVYVLTVLKMIQQGIKVF